MYQYSDTYLNRKRCEILFGIISSVWVFSILFLERREACEDIVWYRDWLSVLWVALGAMATVYFTKHLLYVGKVFNGFLIELGDRQMTVRNTKGEISQGNYADIQKVVVYHRFGNDKGPPLRVLIYFNKYTPFIVSGLNGMDEFYHQLVTRADPKVIKKWALL